MRGETMLQRCGELVGRWATAFITGLHRGAGRLTDASRGTTLLSPHPMSGSDPDFHPPVR